MATERLSMRKTKEILRQKWELGRTHRAIAANMGVSAGVVGATMVRAKACGLTSWSEVEPLFDDELETRIFGKPRSAIGTSSSVATPPRAPDCEWIHRERLRSGVTLELLHVEFLETHPNGLRYTQFCEHYRQWLKRRGLVMRQDHRAGEKMFVDYAGKKPRLFDPQTGELTEVELFVAVLGASNYTYVEATRTQRGVDWIESHVRALEYFGGAPRAIVCDQLKSGVTRACRYEPQVQRTYEELATHYNTTVLPARPKHPRDKAKVETAVLIVERWVLARIRDEVFASLADLNARIRELVDDINQRVMRRYGKSRRELFDLLERPALGALPESRFQYAAWKKATVNIDYHIAYDDHFYSVPYQHAREEVWVRATGLSIEILLRGRRVASHVRSRVRGGHTTCTEHMPSAHRAHAEWNPSRILSWASKIGPETEALCGSILAARPHPEQGYRSCLGILRLEKSYGRERVEAACLRAARVRAHSYRHVATMLRNGLDRLPLKDRGASRSAPIDHENVRGPDYYLN